MQSKAPGRPPKAYILVPRKKMGEFVFTEHPVEVNMSKLTNSPRHYHNLKPVDKRAVEEWLDSISIPLGNNRKKGVTNDFVMRRIALYHYYRRAAEALPKKLIVFHSGVKSFNKLEKQHFEKMDLMTSFYHCRKTIKPEKVIQQMYLLRKPKNRSKSTVKRELKKYAS